MDVEIFDNFFSENFDGKAAPIIKSKGFIIIAGAVAIYALYILFRGGTSTDSAYVSEVGYYSGSEAVSSGSGSGGSYVDAESIMSDVKTAFNEQNAHLNDTLSGLVEDINERFNTIEEDMQSREKESAVNMSIQTETVKSSSSRTKYYRASDAAVTYSDDVNDDNVSAIEKMAQNSVIYMQTDDETVRSMLAAENQKLGASVGAVYDNGKWYTDSSKSERLYYSSTDYDASTETFGK